MVVAKIEYKKNNTKNESIWFFKFFEEKKKKNLEKKNSKWPTQKNG